MLLSRYIVGCFQRNLSVEATLPLLGSLDLTLTGDSCRSCLAPSTQSPPLSQRVGEVPHAEEHLPGLEWRGWGAVRGVPVQG